MYGGLTGLILILAASGAWAWHVKPSWLPLPVTAEKPVASKIKVGIRALPASAIITVDGVPCGTANCSLELTPGMHEAQAGLPGFHAASSSFTLNPGAHPPDVTFSLNPLPTPLTVSFDRDATVTLDGTSLGKIQAGQTETAKLAPGAHKMQIEGGAAGLEFEVQISPGSPPLLTRIIESGEIRAFVFTRFGSQAHLYGTGKGVVVALDGKSTGVLNGGAAGLELTGLAAGSHDVSLDGPRAGDHTKFSFDAGPSGAIFVSLAADASLGVLHIVAGQDDAVIYVNGLKNSRVTHNGEAFVFVRPGSYRVRLEKHGFDTGVEQTVDVRSGEQSQLEFNLVSKVAPHP